MEENKSAKRRERIKTILIIFLIILLLLTFFSNTILNHSLPTVSAQYAGYGTINEKVRGSGYVTANHSYHVKSEGSRTVTSVMIKVGDEVKAGQSLFVLDAADNSEEIKTLEDSIREAELTYQKALLTIAPDYAKENQEIADARADLQNAVNALNAGRNQTGGGISTAAYQQATRQASDAQEKISTLKEYQSLAESGELEEIPAQYLTSAAAAQDALTAAESEQTQAEAALEVLKAEITVTSAEQMENVTTAERSAEAAVTAYERAKVDYEASNNDLDLKRAMEDAEFKARYAKEDAERAREILTGIQEKEAELQAAQERVSTAKQAVADAKSVQSNASVGVIQAIQVEIDAEQKILNDANATVAAYDAQDSSDTVDLTSLEEAVTSAQRNLQGLIIALAETKKNDDITAKGNALDLQSQQLSIEKQKEQLEKLRKDSGSVTIKSENDGVVESIAYAAGDEVPEDATLAEITLTGTGYTVAFTATAEQARKVKVGAAAEITNQFYSDITAKLISAKADPSNPSGQDKLLTFEVTGADVTPGQMLALSIPCSSQSYDCVVPSSAVQNAKDSKFVLIVDSKSTPLGNRYYVRKEEVTVLASDEVSCAVQGNVSASDFVVTTSEKPIKAGDQVRMEES